MKKLILCAAAAAALGGTGMAMAQGAECASGIDWSALPNPCAQGVDPQSRYDGWPYSQRPYWGNPFVWGLAQNTWPTAPDNYYRGNRRDIDGDGIRNNRDNDRDGDGIRNRRDGDRDGDGVRNRHDARPNDPRFR